MVDSHLLRPSHLPWSRQSTSLFIVAGNVSQPDPQQRLPRSCRPLHVPHQASHVSRRSQTADSAPCSGSCHPATPNPACLQQTPRTSRSAASRAPSLQSCPRAVSPILPSRRRAATFAARPRASPILPE